MLGYEIDVNGTCTALYRDKHSFCDQRASRNSDIRENPVCHYVFSCSATAHSATAHSATTNVWRCELWRYELWRCEHSGQICGAMTCGAMSCEHGSDYLFGCVGAVSTRPNLWRYELWRYELWRWEIRRQTSGPTTVTAHVVDNAMTLQNTDSVVLRARRRSHELRTKLAARSAHSNLYLLIFRSRPTFYILATSADDSIPVPK
ncbi:hypothetical protein J6590_067811 [Homalodisca vitripennis]|nr:hypothetical protein J6590_067811 [Homalodisca vitripennis]